MLRLLYEAADAGDELADAQTAGNRGAWMLRVHDVRETVEGKTVLLTTTNGTRAVVAAVQTVAGEPVVTLPTLDRARYGPASGVAVGPPRGRKPEGDFFSWEKTDLADALKRAV